MSILVEFCFSDFTSMDATDAYESGEELFKETDCIADDFFAHSTLTGSPMLLLQLMYRLWLSLITTTSMASMLNWSLTIFTSLTVSTLIDPGAVLLKTQSMMDTFSAVSILRPLAGRLENTFW